MAQDIHSYIISLATAAKKSSRLVASMSTSEKNNILLSIADALEAQKEEILAANKLDVEEAKNNNLHSAMVDRLTLTESRYASMVKGVRFVASLPDPVGEILKTVSRPSGINIKKVRVPFGVVAVVFESRPNVFVDTASLCLKSGNSIILRGGKEAIRTNSALAKCVKAVAGECVQFIEELSHDAVRELVRAVGLVDVAIPRGGERLISAMCEAALIPVLKHYKGVCHIYVDEKADLDMAIKILDNAKTQRPGVCNAAECLLVSESISAKFLPMVEKWASQKGVKLHSGEAGKEYLSLDINVEVVSGLDEAIDFINANSSGHSDCIVTEDDFAAQRFLRDVDSSSVYHNVSTRFTDGAEFGMGAEIGISTDKLHARGPMGLEELTTYKYLITGQGVVRE